MHNKRVLAGGFSLIELLITVLVIVLLTSVVSLNVGDGGRRAKQEDLARHFANVMAYAQAEAEMSGVDHGLYLQQGGGESDATKPTGCAVMIRAGLNPGAVPMRWRPLLLMRILSSG